ncbi:MAG: CopG family transcriptional regulator [Nitrospinae bacterium]|nr:CopG family transcriptional regulator [Nitrospinota bacterium]
MGQVTIYLDETIEKKMNSIVQNSHLSKSKWVANLIHEKVSHEWPESVTKLSGAWKDFPSAEELRDNFSEDLQRENI